MAVSELVTNAVLHAATGPTVTIHINEFVRLEVQDTSRAHPMLVNYGRDAVTGRGLSVVSRAARKWGVDSTQYGKTVWAEFDVADTSVFGEEQLPHTTSEIIVEKELGEDAKTVYFNGVPVDLYIQLEEHNDATLREFELLAIQLEKEIPESVLIHHKLASLVVRSTKFFDAPKSRLRMSVQRAQKKGLPTVNLKSTLDGHTIVFAKEFISLMAEADLLGDQGALLTSPAPHNVRQLRYWFIEEMQHQFVDGRPPIAFSP